jgi:tetratricopeptide (TPR) repeat protein
VPKVKRVGGSGRGVVYLLLALITLLLAAVAFMLFGGFFDDEPRTDLERDYQQLVSALEEYPDNPSILMALAEVEFMMGRKSDAFDHAEQAAQAATSTAGIPMSYARMLAEDGRYEDAIVWVDRELELLEESKSADAKFLKARILWEMEQQDEALELIERALELAYTAGDVRIVYADWLAELGRDDEAIDQYYEALQYLPGDERAIAGLESLGETYVEPTSTVDPHSETGE